jgi:hypothetical protein
VIVHKKLHPDTIVSTNLCMRNFTKPATGPVVVIPDIDHSTMQIKQYSGGKIEGIVE